MDTFTLSDTRPLINLNGRKAIFKTEQFGNYSERLSKALRDIVDELKKRDFSVPGFVVEFWFEAHKAEVKVFKILSDEFYFEVVSDWQVMIKGKEMSVFKDGSGSLEVYCGSDWETDAKEFMHGKRFHRKMDNKSRIVLQYDLRGDTFKATDDCGRGHYPDGNEPVIYGFDSVEYEFADYAEMILGKIKAAPLPEKEVDVFVEPDQVPLTNELFKGVSLRAFSKYYGEDETMTKGIMPGHRLLNLGCTLPEGHKYAKDMHDGFVYMEVVRDGQDDAFTQPRDTYQFNYSSYDGKHTYDVKLKNANSVYVVDAGVFDRIKEEWFKENPVAVQITDAQVDDFMRKQAETMVHINDYDGSYEKPVVITNRIVWPDELTQVKQLAKA